MELKRLENKIIWGDCLDVMKRLPDKSVDLCLTDPPYGIGMDNSNKRVKPSRPNSYTQYADFRYPQADWDKKPIDEEYFSEIFRISKNQIIFGANYYSEYMPNGFGWIFWDKMNGKNNDFSDGEIIFKSVGVKTKMYNCSNFNGLHGGIDKVHPTQKPLRLIKNIVADFSDENDLILDCFLGSGTTAVACVELGRRFIGIERELRYCGIARKRVDAVARQGKLFQGAV